MKADRGQWVDGLAHWRDEETRTAFLSIAFTWKIAEARTWAEYYAGLGYRVRAGGPGLFRLAYAIADVAEVDTVNGIDGVGNLPDALRRHNPMAVKASTGCPVGCGFCIVTPMEGATFTLLPEFEPRPILTDNNLSALPADYQQYIVDRYRAFGVPLLDANSGFEPKTFDEEVYRRWKPINKGPWRFGLDETFETEDAKRVISMLKRDGVGARRIRVYVMIGREPFAESMERIRTVIGMGAEPYVQPEMKLNAREKKPWVRHDWTPELLSRVQRWANSPMIWRKTEFADYDSSIRTNPRQAPGGLL